MTLLLAGFKGLELFKLVLAFLFHLKSARIPHLQTCAGRSPTLRWGGIAVRYGMYDSQGKTTF
ncbi:hypothetical protein J9303_00585, partial [Bacillaceae bacterium Marseille-Q3522]|nr:hypothetical protein [Bacillaceae bacterium Marseille-Q3522]